MNDASQIYAAYAPIYDQIGQGRFGEQMARWTLRWLGATPRHVLDLACGAGAAALVFAQAGAQTLGVDQSAAMLAIARGRARDAGLDMAFAQADIRALPIEMSKQDAPVRSISPSSPSSVQRSALSVQRSSFDVVTCFADSLNYLTGDDDLALVCGGVAAALRPGGWFVFDLNTSAEFATWDERDLITYDGPDALVYNRLNFDAAARLATGRIVWFVRETDRWWRGEETHVERAWADAEVRAALVAAGLAPEPPQPVQDSDGRRVIWAARRL